MRKYLSLLLAVLMVVSCIPAALSFGVAAEEPAAPEAPAVSYKDPRETATKIYYAPLSRVTAAMLADDEYYASSTKISSNAYVYSALTTGSGAVPKVSFEPGSVLVIPFTGNEELNFATNKGLGRTEHLAFTAPTLFRTDGTKLPIIIEGVKNGTDVPTLVLDYNSNYVAYSALAFANDYYFSNLTIKKATSTAQTFFAGSGNVVFHNVTFDFNASASITFAGDTYSAEPFYGWTEERFNANKGEDGLLRAGFTFGKNTSVASSVVLAAVAADAHSGTDAYKTSYPKVGTDLTESNINTAVTNSKSVKYVNGKMLSNNANCIVLPIETSTYITIDNGKADSSTADFTKVYTRKGCSPVAKAEVKLVSGNVQYIYGDAYTGSDHANGVKNTYTNIPNREVYVGDTTITIDGGNVTSTVLGMLYSHLIGNYTINVNGGYVARINGTEGVVSTASIKGNYLFHATGGTVKEYYGGCAVIGEGNTVKTVIDGGTFTSVFNCLRFAVSEITNEINGGVFNCDFRGGSNGNYSGSNITNVITGGEFNKNLYAGGTHASATLGTVTTNVSGGTFNCYFAKGGAAATSNTINIVSTQATDEIVLLGATTSTPRTYTFDNIDMNGGTIVFWAVKVTATAAKGDFTVLNKGEWLVDNTYFTLTPAEGATLNVTPTQSASVTTRGEVVTEGGKYLVVADTTGISPIGASLVLNERIAVKFVFAKSDVDAIGKDDFVAAVLLNGFDIAAASALVEDGDTYTLTTLGIGLPDAKTPFTLAGDGIKASGYSIASLADAAITAWETAEPEWADWAKALKNLIGVAVDGSANTIAPADKDYGTFTASKNEPVTGGVATLVMNSAVGVELDLTCATLPATPVVKVNGKEIANVYTTEGSNAIVTLYFAPQAMEKTFTVQILDGTAEIFSLEASVAGFAKTLNTDAGNALLAYIQATTTVAGK